MTYSERVLADLKDRYPEQPQFIQAATEVLETIQPALDGSVPKAGVINPGASGRP